jgi:hypothetical protein
MTWQFRSMLNRTSNIKLKIKHRTVPHLRDCHDDISRRAVVSQIAKRRWFKRMSTRAVGCTTHQRRVRSRGHMENDAYLQRIFCRQYISESGATAMLACDTLMCFLCKQRLAMNRDDRQVVKERRPFPGLEWDYAEAITGGSGPPTTPYRINSVKLWYNISFNDLFKDILQGDKLYDEPAGPICSLASVST